MLYHYLSTALRSFRRSPYVASVNIVGLALGLACFLGAYAAVNYMEGSDRHFATAQRAYAIAQRQYSPSRGFDTGARPGTSPIAAKFLAEEFPELEAVARADQLEELDARTGTVETRLAAVAADPQFMKIFPFELQSASEEWGSPRSIVLTAAAAERLFGTTNVVGKTVTLVNAIDLQVAAVIRRIPSPSQFDASPLSALRFDMLIPWAVMEEMEYRITGRRFSEQPAAVQWSRTSGLTYVLLPASGALTAEGFNERLTRFAEKYVPPQRREMTAYEFSAIPVAQVWKSALNAALFRGSDLSITWLTQILGSLVLIVACLNYANLAAAAAVARSKEASVRRVLGATARQVAVQSIVEAAIAAMAAFLLALSITSILAPLLRNASGIDLIAVLGGSISLWLCAGAAIAITSLIAGLYPAMVLARARPGNALRQKLRGQSSTIARVLVGTQFATASLLLIAVAVVFQQGRELHAKGLGAGADRTLVVMNGLAASGVAFDTLRNELLRLPGVESVSAIGQVPWGHGSTTYSVARDMASPGSVVTALMHSVTPGFEATLGMRLMAGRNFDAARGDDRLPEGFPVAIDEVAAQRVPSVVIDQQMSRQLGWHFAQDAVDQIVYIPRTQLKKKELAVRIIGVVEDKPLRLLGSGTTGNIFSVPAKVSGYPLVRMRQAEISATLDDIEAAWRKLAQAAPLQRRFLDEQFELSYQLFERIGRVITAITAFAFVISVMGLFGMAVFIAHRRRHEIGVRKTLGASVGQILRMLLRDLSAPVVIANLAVWPLAYLAANAYLNVFTHRVALTPLPFLISLVLTVLVAWLAVGGQALRAARVRPSQVLRYE